MYAVKVRYAKFKIRRHLENTLGLFIEKAFRDGLSDCLDLNKSGWDISVVFDAGAHIGESASKFRATFPRARIHCFEPVKKTFDVLQKELGKFTNIAFHNLALGNNNGQEKIYLYRSSARSSLIQSNTMIGSELIEVTTVERFCRENNIEKIDILKIDTQGSELEVLKGAEHMLLAGTIPFVLVEVGFHPGVDNHVLFEDISAYLLSKGYAVYGFYDQLLENSGNRRLRCANVCFSHLSLCRSIS